MENSAEIIAAVRNVIKERTGAAHVSDYAVAKALHISPQAMSHRKHGRVFTISDETAVHAAEILGLDSGYVLAIVHAEIAERTRQEAAAVKWRELAALLRTGARAASATGLFILGAVLATPKTATAAQDGAALLKRVQLSNVYYVKRLRAILRGFTAILYPHPCPVFA